MSPRVATYPTWKEVFGRRPTEEEVLVEICQFDRLNTLWLLARINLLLTLERVHATEAVTMELQTFLVNLFFDDDLFERLKEKFGTERLVNRTPFHSLQVLVLARMVALHSMPAGGLRPDTDRAASLRLGRCLLMVNDLLSTPKNLARIRRNRPSRKLMKLALQLQVGAGLEVNNPPPIYGSILRSDIVFNELLGKSRFAAEIREAFLRTNGITLEDYIDHVFGVLTYFLTLDFRKLINEPGLAVVSSERFFAQGDRTIASKFWSMEVTSAQQLEDSLREPSTLKEYHDFITVRKRPFLQTIDDGVIPIHLGFVQEKLESGLFWTIVNSLPERDDRARLFTEWGHLFEGYVSQTVAECFTRDTERYIPFPRFTDNNDEAFDGMIAAGSHLFVMEYKGGFLTANAKYAENERAFIEDLNRKFGSGPGAGVEQLVRKIRDLFAAKESNRRAINGFDSSKVRIVVPLLIVQESFVSSELTANYLADVFGNLKRREQLDRNAIHTFPLVLDIAEVEMLKLYITSGAVTFTDCLMSRIKLGASQVLSFRDFFNGYVQERRVVRPKDQQSMPRYLGIMERISQRFFHKPFDAPDALENELGDLNA
jgi:hypothetical protein